MTYTHCRGCGVKLTPGDRADVDGLCLGLTFGCNGKLIQWRRENKTAEERRLEDEAETDFWLQPEWQVAIDEWLAATR